LKQGPTLIDASANQPPARLMALNQFDGLYGQTSIQHTGNYLFSELLETRSSLFDWVIEPHFHARLFQVFFIETGEVEFSEATQKRRLSGPVVLLIPPTFLHGLTYTPGAQGRILTLADSWLPTLFPPTSAVTSMLESIQYIPVVEEPYTASVVSQLFAEIDEEFFGNRPEKHSMLPLCLQRLFLILYRLW
jgi:AraC family transcriptional activator of pobA